MTVKVSKIYGMDIYTDGGKFLGRVQEILLDLEKGEVVRLTMEPLNSVSKDEAKRILRDKSVLYKSVKFYRQTRAYIFKYVYGDRR